jgi:Golgi phosphoprotein 3 GPP34
VSRGLDSVRVADQLYWLAHTDDQRGRLRPRVLGLVLATGLLGEMLIDDRVGLWNGDLLAVVADREPVGHAVQNGRTQVQDAAQVAAFIYEQVSQDPHQRLATWIDALALRAPELVVGRLQVDGLLVSASGFRLARRGKRFGPACTARGANVATLPWALLSTRLSRGEWMNVADSFVVAVAMVAGLRGHLLAGTTATAERHAGVLTEGLPADLRQVVAEVEAAVAKEVLVQRR